MSDTDSRETGSRLLTIPHVADRLDCCVRFVWTLIAQGHLTRIVLSARATRIAESEVNALIEAKTRRQLPPDRTQGRPATRRPKLPGEQRR